MSRFSEVFGLGLSQHELDFVDVSKEYDTPVYVDPYAIEISDDIWSAQASEHIRSFFREVLDAIRADDVERATNLMSHLHEPAETFLGISRLEPKGRGLGSQQAGDLIRAICTSEAYRTGILSDLSEMALYVEGIDRDKISDLTTNIIRGLLIEYTQQQCDLYNVAVRPYSGPPIWDMTRLNWVSRQVTLPFIDGSAVLLVPKYIVRRKLSLDSQEFYNKQITDFLVAENLRANSSLVQTLKGGKRKVYKKDVRAKAPKSKKLIAEFAYVHPELLELYKKIAKEHKAEATFNDEQDSITLTAACSNLASLYSKIPPGNTDADKYHNLVLGSLTALFYPDLIQPHKEWEIHGGRKRIDIVFTNASNVGFFAQRRDEATINANTVIVECKNYSNDLANAEIDQLLGRFDNNRGKFGILTCRSIDDRETLMSRLRDAASHGQGYIIALTDQDLVEMLRAKSNLKSEEVEATLYGKFRELLA